MNLVILSGRLTKDPEIRYNPSNQMCIAKFTLAIDRNGRKGEQKVTDFPRVTVFGKQAEACDKVLKKGFRCSVQGELQTGSYQGKDGKTVYTQDVVATKVEFIDWPQQQGEAPAAPIQQPQPPMGQPVFYDDEM